MDGEANYPAWFTVRVHVDFCIHSYIEGETIVTYIRLKGRKLQLKARSSLISCALLLSVVALYLSPQRTFAVDSTRRNASAGDITADLFVPVVISSPGEVGSFYTTELTFTNRGNTTANVDLSYTAASGGGTGTVSVYIPPGQMVISDAIDYLKTLGLSIPDGGSQVGTLRAHFSNLNSASEVYIMARTTTAVKDGGGTVVGHAGLAYPALSLSSSGGTAISQVNKGLMDLSNGGGLASSTSQLSAGLNGLAYICGLRLNYKDRSNVAFQNLGTATDGDITLQAYVSDGWDWGTLGAFVLAPGAFVQVNNVFAGGTDLRFFWVDRTSGTAPYYAYGVINDMVSSDGSFVPPFPVSRFPVKPTPAAGLTLPVIVQTSTFSTELILEDRRISGNIGESIDFAFVSDAVTTGDHIARFSIILTEIPWGQLIIPDIFAYMREHRIAGIPPAGTTIAGALFATLSTSGDMSGIFLGARTSTAGGSVGGRFGVFYTAVPYGRASTTSAWVYGLQQNAENRTNLAIVNTGEVDASNATFVIDLYDGATGNLVKTMDPINLKAHGWKQIGTILTNAPGVTQGYAHVRRITGNNPFITYAVINDGAGPGQRTGDGAFIASSQ